MPMPARNPRAGFFDWYLEEYRNSLDKERGLCYILFRKTSK